MILEFHNKARKILVIGDVMLDAYWLGSVNRISPEAPVPVLAVKKKTHVPGGAANVALNCSKLGANVQLVGVVGADAAATQLRDALCSSPNKIEFSAVQDASRPTTLKTRIVSGGQQIVRIDEEVSATLSSEIEKSTISACLEALATHPEVIVISDYGKGVVTQRLCSEVIKHARNLNIPVLVDPKGSDYRKYSGATIISPNKAELALATGIALGDINGLIREGQKLCETLNCANIVFTRSEEGISLLGTSTHEHFPATAREVVDVCGAGDAVISTLAVALAHGRSTVDAVWIANVAGGLAVQKFGTAAISLQELNSECALLTQKNQTGKIKSLETISVLLERWRSNGEKIVFTNGCFDLFHVGHLKLLESCKALGTKLVVGLNSDASVSRLKGPQRPVVPHEQRAQVLSGLEAVDAVVMFEEDTPLNLIKEIRPNILAKGGDYTIESVVGAPFVHSYGGRVELISLVDGVSTSSLVSRIAERYVESRGQ